MGLDIVYHQSISDQVAKLRVPDFEFRVIDASDRESCRHVRAFIERHARLGTLPNRPTHRFVALYNGEIAGALIAAIPIAFSKLLGPDTPKYEKLIARGASISWAPKNLGSWLITQSCNWMIYNTQFRVFTAYADPEARELGTVYQAANWFYLGQEAGGSVRYFDPENPDKGWFSDREFRKRSQWVKYAKQLGCHADLLRYFDDASHRWTPNWEAMPADLKRDLKTLQTAHKARCKTHRSRPKHKYAYIKGRDERETKRLIALFREHSPKLWDTLFDYPRDRGA